MKIARSGQPSIAPSPIVRCSGKPPIGPDTWREQIFNRSRSAPLIRLHKVRTAEDRINRPVQLRLHVVEHAPQPRCGHCQPRRHTLRRFKMRKPPRQRSRPADIRRSPEYPKRGSAASSAGTYSAEKIRQQPRRPAAAACTHPQQGDTEFPAFAGPLRWKHLPLNSYRPSL
ncbi:MAG: hypothetical protein U5P10_08395 [Spirochaetia bacterium]|nr:hypothetical protein [Spirochaetia bacterium]